MTTPSDKKEMGTLLGMRILTDPSVKDGRLEVQKFDASLFLAAMPGFIIDSYLIGSDENSARIRYPVLNFDQYVPLSDLNTFIRTVKFMLKQDLENKIEFHKGMISSLEDVIKAFNTMEVEPKD